MQRFLWSLVPNLLKDKIQQTQPTQQQSSRALRLPRGARCSRSRAWGMQECSFARDRSHTRVAKHPHHTPALQLRTALATTLFDHLLLNRFWRAGLQLHTGSSVRMQSVAGQVQPRMNNIPWYKMSGFCH